MAASSSSKPNMENVAQLESITGLPRTQAIELLEASGHDLEKAIELHFGGEVIASKPSIKSNGTTNGKAKTANKRAITEVESEINSELVSSDSNSQSYFDSGDNVRAPIAPTFGRLCDYDPYGIVNSILKFKDLQVFNFLKENSFWLHKTLNFKTFD